ncbi:HAD family hydrolase [Streptomyces yangpuensis]|uniref:HAD family hydrolase n=1 Tax=Streptomyces yangpuensis TaxID=1648182 RepID=UPI00366A3AA1
MSSATGPAADALERANGLRPGALAAAAFALGRLQPAVTGRITDEQWRDAVAADLADTCGSRERALAAVRAWSELVPTVDQEVVTLLRDLSEVASVALVSNATTRLEQDLERQGLAGLADCVVNTARIGLAKPDPQVYRIAAERLGTAVDRCLFVDDTPARGSTRGGDERPPLPSHRRPAPGALAAPRPRGGTAVRYALSAGRQPWVASITQKRLPSGSARTTKSGSSG